MAEEVVVRFVPKTRSAAPRLDFSFESLATAPREFLPDPGRASTALGWFAGRRNVDATTTDGSRLEVSMAQGDFNQLFATKLRPGKFTKRTNGRLTSRESYLVPAKSLPVPDALKDTIEFAYVPRPIEFYGVSVRPPNECIEHVRLDDVCAALNAARAHRESRTGAGVKVAMVDSGFHPHPFFAANGYKLVATAAPGAVDPEIDASGHGTGESANIFTIAPDCTVYGVKTGPSSATSLEAAIALNPDVMSNSWGFDIDHESRDELKVRDPNLFNEVVDIETILTDAVRSGIVVVFAAGNGHRAFPACMPQVIAAGGVTLLSDGSFEASSYASSFESKLYPGRRVPDLCGIVGTWGKDPQKNHIMLPVPPESVLDGSNFASGKKKSGWGIFSGTSAACPQLAGAVALIRGVRKGATTDQARTALVKTALDITAGKSALNDAAGQGHDLATGAGLANSRAACEFVASIA
jgi:serine protease AprX